MKFFYTITFVILFAANSLQAQQIAKYAGEFLALGVGGRALALGGTQVALANDVTAGYWNPAGLMSIDYPQFVLMHDERYGGIVNYDYGAAAIPYGNNASLGISVMRLGVDGVPDTRNAGVDANGNPLPLDQQQNMNRLDYSKITYFNSANWAVYFSYAQRYTETISFGINTKVIHESIADASATGIGFDIGALYAVSDAWVIGATVQDVTTTLVAWSTGTDELISPTVKIGTVYYFDLFGGRFAPTCDVDIRFENRQFASIANLGPVSFDPHEGLEFDFKKTFALRVGYSDVKQLTLGAGLHLKKLDIDYSYAQFGTEDDLGKTHRISLLFTLRAEKYSRSSE